MRWTLLATTGVACLVSTSACRSHGGSTPAPGCVLPDPPPPQVTIASVASLSTGTTGRGYLAAGFSIGCVGAKVPVPTLYRVDTPNQQLRAFTPAIPAVFEILSSADGDHGIAGIMGINGKWVGGGTPDGWTWVQGTALTPVHLGIAGFLDVKPGPLGWVAASSAGTWVLNAATGQSTLLNALPSEKVAFAGGRYLASHGAAVDVLDTNGGLVAQLPLGYTPNQLLGSATLGLAAGAGSASVIEADAIQRSFPMVSGSCCLWLSPDGADIFGVGFRARTATGSVIALGSNGGLIDVTFLPGLAVASTTAPAGELRVWNLATGTSAVAAASLSIAPQSPTLTAPLPGGHVLVGFESLGYDLEPGAGVQIAQEFTIGAPGAIVSGSAFLVSAPSLVSKKPRLRRASASVGTDFCDDEGRGTPFDPTTLPGEPPASTEPPQRRRKSSRKWNAMRVAMLMIGS